MVQAYNLVDGGGGIGTYSVPADYTIPWISVETTSLTAIKIIIKHPTAAPGSFGGAITSYTFNDPDFVFPVSGDTIVVSTDRTTITKSGLIPGTLYDIRVRAYSGASQAGTYGPYITDTFKMPITSTSLGVVSTATTVLIPPGSTADAAGATSSSKSSSGVSVNNSSLDYGVDDGVQVQEVTGSSFATSGNRKVEKSLFILSNISADPTAYSVATKDTGIAKTYSHYSFGTGMFFQSSATNVDAAGGIGFFTDNIGKSGYYVLMQTTSNISNNSDRTVKILKVVNGRVVPLNDSQNKNPANPLTGILGATSYKVDIKVKVSSGVRVIDVYINNFKISAIDTDSTTSTDPINKVLPVTSNISMCATTGSAYYDYVYAMPLEESQYNSGIMQNVYNGQFNDTILNFLYGDKVLSNFNKTTLKKSYQQSPMTDCQDQCG